MRSTPYSLERTQLLWTERVSSPVGDGQSDILGAVFQGDVRVLGAELDVLPAGVGHREGQGHGLELLGCGLVVADVHQARDEILINLGGTDQIRSEQLCIL